MSLVHKITREIESAQPTMEVDPRRTVRPVAPNVPTAPSATHSIAGLDHIAPVAAGGMGLLERRRQAELGREVAVKRLLVPGDPLGARLLRREARLTARVTHPNVVPVHDLRHDEALGPLLVMKRLRGHTWFELISAAPRHPSLNWYRHQVRILRQICRALQHAHSRGVLHLDVKADNVIVTPDGDARLLDWGIAYDLRGDPPRSQILGTPAFMAPEMVKGTEKALDERTDVYLAGGCLYEILYGRGPHEAESYVLSVRSIFDGVVFPPTGAPAELIRIAKRALAMDPDARFPTMRALCEALDAYDRHHDSITISEAVTTKLDEQDLPIDEREHLVHRLTAALTLWPENPDALEALRALRIHLLLHYLDVGDIMAAHRCAAALSPAPEELAERLEVAANERAELLEAPTVLAERLRTNKTANRTLVTASVLVWSLLMMGYGFTYLRFPTRVPETTSFWGYTGLSMFACGVMVSTRERWWPLLPYRASGMAFLACIAGVWVNHLCSLFDERPIQVVVVVDALTVGVVALGSSSLDARRGVSAALIFTVAVVAACLPLYTTSIVVGGLCISYVLWLVLVLRSL